MREVRVETGELQNGVYLARGPEFYERFMANFIMPRRFDMVQMIVASMIQAGEPVDDEAVGRAFKLADTVLLQERETLDSVMHRYWDVYLANSRSVDEVMEAVADAHQDYTL